MINKTFAIAASLALCVSLLSCKGDSRLAICNEAIPSLQAEIALADSKVLGEQASNRSIASVDPDSGSLKEATPLVLARVEWSADELKNWEKWTERRLREAQSLLEWSGTAEGFGPERAETRKSIHHVANDVVAFGAFAQQGNRQKMRETLTRINVGTQSIHEQVCK